MTAGAVGETQRRAALLTRQSIRLDTQTRVRLAPISLELHSGGRTSNPTGSGPESLTIRTRFRRLVCGSSSRFASKTRENALRVSEGRFVGQRSGSVNTEEGKIDRRGGSWSTRSRR